MTNLWKLPTLTVQKLFLLVFYWHSATANEKLPLKFLARVPYEENEVEDDNPMRLSANDKFVTIGSVVYQN